MSTTVATNIKRKRIYVNDKGITVPEFEKNNTKRNYDVVGESCRDEVAERAAGALVQKEKASIDEVINPLPQEMIQPQENKPATLEEKGKKIISELEDLALEELKKDLMNDKEFKDKLKAKLLKKIFK